MPLANKSLATFLFLFWCAAGAVSQNIPRPNIFAPKATGVEVNSYTGGVHYSKPLFQLPARGLDIDLTLSYNSAHDTLDWGYGYGWTHTYNQRYWQESGKLVVLRADGRTDRFSLENGAYQAPAGIFDTLIQNGTDKYLLVSKHGEKYFFENGLLTRIEDRNGNAITLEYQGTHLNKVKDASGLRWLEFSWQDDICTAVSDHFDPGDIRAFSLGYTNGTLTSMIDPLNGKMLFAYEQHLLTRITDENENETLIEYNDGGAATLVASCLTKQNITYNTTGMRTYVGELVGNVNQITTYEYDSLGRNTARHGNCCGYDLTYTYDDDLNATSMADGNGNLRKYEFDEKGNVVKAVDPYDHPELFSYNEFSLVKSYTDKKSNFYNYHYDAKGNLTKIEKPENVAEEYTYDGTGQNTTYTDGEGHTTHYYYDGFGNLKTIVYPTLDSVTFTYDLRGNRLSETDANGNTTLMAYDKLNRLVEEWDALNFKTSYAYDARSNRILMVNAAGDSTFYKYDGLDRLVEVKAPMGLTTRYTYDSRGNILRIFDPRGGVVQYEYNERNQPVSMKDPLGKVTHYIYDGNGNQISMSDPNNLSTDYEFDKLDRLVKTKDALGNETNYVYDLNGNLVLVTDANGKSTTYTFDGLNRQISMTDAMQFTTSYAYDKNDNLLQITDANDHSTTYVYDPKDRVALETFADGTTKAYWYDGVGNVIQRKDNKGDLTQYEYDPLQRLTKRTYPGGSYDSFTYDPLGQMTLAQNAAAVVSFEYDDAGRLVLETLNGKTTHYGYNTAAGKRIVTYPSGRIVEEFFDKRNQLVQVKADGALVTAFTYDDAGRLAGRQYGNGTQSALTYDDGDRITGLLHRKGGVDFVHFAYAFDKVGNKQYERKLHHATHSELFEYDDLYRLTAFKVGTVAANGAFSNPITQTTYDYDPLGNRNSVETDGATTIYAANEMNEYTSISGQQNITPTHDGNGNLTCDGSHTYTFDFENRLVAVDNGATATYAYDALGRRIRREVGGVVTLFYFDGFREIEERDVAGNVTATYVFGTWIDDILQMKRGGDVYFYHSNSLGSVVALTNAAGEVVERYEYEGFGAVHFLNPGFGEIPATAVGNEVLFTGRRLDSGLENIFFRTRNYSPNQGRFLIRDLLGYSEGFNLYNAYFVPNKIDPIGTASIHSCSCPCTVPGCCVEPYKPKLNCKKICKGYGANCMIVCCDEKCKNKKDAAACWFSCCQDTCELFDLACQKLCLNDEDPDPLDPGDDDMFPLMPLVPDPLFIPLQPLIPPLLPDVSIPWQSGFWIN